MQRGRERRARTGIRHAESVAHGCRTLQRIRLLAQDKVRSGVRGVSPFRRCGHGCEHRVWRQRCEAWQKGRCEHLRPVHGMPARDAVKGARYEAVGVARLVFQVPELNKSILEIVPGAYGEAKKALRFLMCRRRREHGPGRREVARCELSARRAERRF